MIILFVIFFLLFVPAIADDTPTDPRSFLAKTSPLLYEPEILATRVDAPQYSLQDIQLIHKQLAAIVTLSSEKEKGDVTLLIPYLGYTDKPSAVMFSFAPTINENVQETRSNWPVFSAILDNPNAEKELELYIINRSNPLNTRLTAWLVLRYIDKDKFEKVSKLINIEIKEMPVKIQNYVAAVEQGSKRFRGIEFTDK